MYPSRCATARTRCAQASLTRFGCFGRLSTRLAVVRLTPASFATSDKLAIQSLRRTKTCPEPSDKQTPPAVANSPPYRNHRPECNRLCQKPPILLHFPTALLAAGLAPRVQ